MTISPKHPICPGKPPTVKLNTLTIPSYVQTVVGKYSLLSEDIEEFRGIPYGFINSRWENSQLRTHLPCDVFDAKVNGPRCPQPASRNHSKDYQAHVDFPIDVQESEFKCLNLLIIRPKPSPEGQKLSERQNLPVMVYIHGGAYGFGAASDPIWDPTRLVLRSMQIEKPFIAVLINYRLNVFGFAASSDILADQSASALKGLNFGIRDQKVALNWVSRNISAFGGDPEKITLAGQSAGSHSVHLFLLEAELGHAKPLFRNAIMQSGAIGVLGPCSLEDANLNWELLCRKCGLNEANMTDTITRMREVPADDLLEIGETLGWFQFPLVIDDKTVFKTDLGYSVQVDIGQAATAELYTKSNPKRLPEVMLGYTDTEASVVKHNVMNIQTFDDIRSIFAAAYRSPKNLDEVLALYQLGPQISIEGLRHRLLQFLSDVMFNYPIYEARDFLVAHRTKKTPVGTTDDFTHGLESDSEKNGKHGVHFYKINFGNPFPGADFGVAHHCVDLIYLFDAFHDDLKKADMVDGKLLTPTLKRGDNEAISNRKLDKPAPRIAQKPELTPETFPTVQGQRRSNHELREELQDRWIQFICNDNQEKSGRVRNGQLEEIITVWGQDRLARTESLTSDPQWIKVRGRMDNIGRNIHSAKAVLKSVSGIVLT